MHKPCTKLESCLYQAFTQYQDKNRNLSFSRFDHEIAVKESCTSISVVVALKARLFELCLLDTFHFSVEIHWFGALCGAFEMLTVFSV